MLVNGGKRALIYPNMCKALTFGIMGEEFSLLGAIAFIQDIRPSSELYFLWIKPG